MHTCQCVDPSWSRLYTRIGDTEVSTSRRVTGRDTRRVPDTRDVLGSDRASVASGVAGRVTDRAPVGTDDSGRIRLRCEPCVTNPLGSPGFLAFRSRWGDVGGRGGEKTGVGGYRNGYFKEVQTTRRKTAVNAPVGCSCHNTTSGGSGGLT